MHGRNEILSHLAGDVRHLVPLSPYPEVPWSVFRRRYPVQFEMGLVLAGEVMVGSIVRRIPKNEVAARHRYKVENRMIGDYACHMNQIIGSKISSSPREPPPGPWTWGGAGSLPDVLPVSHPPPGHPL